MYTGSSFYQIETWMMLTLVFSFSFSWFSYLYNFLFCFLGFTQITHFPEILPVTSLKIKNTQVTSNFYFFSACTLYGIPHLWHTMCSISLFTACLHLSEHHLHWRQYFCLGHRYIPNAYRSNWHSLANKCLFAKQRNLTLSQNGIICISRCHTTR